MSLRHAKERGAKTAAIVNVVGSSIARMVDRVILQGSGPEVCVVSTKAALVQMILLTRLAHRAGCAARHAVRGAAPASARPRWRRCRARSRRLLNEKSGLIRAAAYRHAHVQNWLFLGRGVYYPIALEAGAEDEGGHLRARRRHAGRLPEARHAVAGRRQAATPWCSCRRRAAGELHAMTMSSVEEVKARGGFVFGFTFDARRRHLRRAPGAGPRRTSSRRRSCRSSAPSCSPTSRRPR